MDNNITPQDTASVAPPAPQQRIILDTNVISRIDSTDQGMQIGLYLLELSKRGFGFALSDVIVYELLRGNLKAKEAKMLESLADFFSYYLTTNVMIAAAQLDNLMKIDEINVNSVDYGDKLIAATAILTGSLILTNNSRDFPWPFFHEVEPKSIFYKEGEKQKCLCLALLQPDIQHINLRFNERP